MSRLPPALTSRFGAMPDMLRSGGRFFIANLFGISFDILLALALHEWLGLSLPVAAAVSLGATACLVYVVHEVWTFRRPGPVSLAWRRFAGTLASALSALAIRAACLYGTGVLAGLGDDYALLQLGFAAGLSFAVNFAILHGWVMRGT